MIFRPVSLGRGKMEAKCGVLAISCLNKQHPSRKSAIEPLNQSLDLNDAVGAVCRRLDDLGIVLV